MGFHAGFQITTEQAIDVKAHLEVTIAPKQFQVHFLL